ncbi:GNAT family N-acetyltransferase [Nisaea acidiphila]|uniref:GNAT family N-acetyltransferase n=1 Tax=Nisaea acidiphila TaxID=1862145 RepID=A0A9J7AXV0_9PROT|nr:GNAT family N-acetyltransferase [Nisaea acidiphila]UUX51084.1 GNAT family N-acetyltransferase [Nisaea acidiphila]
MEALLDIRIDDLSGTEIAALLSAHMDHGNAHSPPESVHALDIDGLRAPDITFWSVWEDGELLGCGAIRELSPEHGELKSMHTAARHRGKGVGRAMVEHILKEARARGYRRISLETGSMEAFAPARALYARFGFTECPPFGSYSLDPYSTFMTCELAA